MKKTVMNQMKKKVYRAAGRAAAAALLLSMAGLPVMEAAASEKQVVTYVYHQHTGNSSEKGGCYQEPVYHTHLGSEEEGGECYQTPVYHTHTGDEENGGECYKTPVLHLHTGNPEEGGGCFVAVYHSHTASCYKTVSSEEYGCTIVNWWDTSDGDDGVQDFKYFQMSCGVTVHGTNSSHTHNILICSKSGTIEGYTLGCGKTEESVDSYLFDCEKTEGQTIDAYLLSCEKTEETIEGYGISCGKDEETPCGIITVDLETQENRKKVLLTAAFEDLTGGELTLLDEPYVWRNQNGKIIGTGQQTEVLANGRYSVTVGVSNEDINKDSLRAEITVSSIAKSQGGGDTDGGDTDGDDTDGDDTGDGDVPEQEDQTDDDTDIDLGQQEITPSPSVSPDLTPEAARKSGSGKQDQSKEETPILQAMESVPLPNSETKSVTIRENSSQDTEIQEIKEVAKDSKKSMLRQLFERPGVRLISITAAALLVLTGLSLLLYLLRTSVRVYNDDSEGNLIRLGRCRVQLKEEGYTINISDGMAEKAITNRYCIKPGIFRLFRSEEEEIIVCRQEKRVSVSLSREMIVVL